LSPLPQAAEHWVEVSETSDSFCIFPVAGDRCYFLVSLKRADWLIA
jgi:hypothetical protein